MSSDLHMHTSFSDGKLAPEELVAAAVAAKLNYIAITDHDTVDGICHLYEAGLYPAKAIHIIPGIEISAHHNTHDVHILGYNIDIYNRKLTDQLNDVVEARWTRFSEMVEKLRQLGYAITEAEVLKLAGTSKAISRSHIARVLVQKGFFASLNDVFMQVLDKGKPAYVPHYRLETEEIVKLIKDAGGIPVLAHPRLIHDDELVESLLDKGIEGLEVFYPQHDEEDVERYRRMAEEHHLLISGGSDFHGFVTRYPQQLGMFTIEDVYAEKFFKPASIL
jgi:3',5'-nucleoside bisphosphate phosphatase